MIVDSSVLVAILRNEPDAETFADLLQSSNPQVSDATVLETSIVVGPARHVDVDELLTAVTATVVPFDAAQARLARQAYATYGKGSGSPAGLNLGDCFSYALAKTTGLPLLFKGDDFTHTDVTPALTP